MAYNPYDLARVARPSTPAAGGGKYALARPAPLTQNGQEEEAQNLQGLQTGKFADVQSAAAATQRANTLRSSQSLQAARGTVARAGDMSPEAALRAQDQAFASASAQNLNADNSVNQLQRQYRQDALNKAGQIEDRAYKGATDERAYQTDADRYNKDQDWKGYEADVGEENRLFGQNFQLGEQARQQGNTDRDYGEGVRRYDLGRADTKGTQAEDTRRFDLQYGASREDRASDVGFRDKQYGDSRDDVAYNRTEDRSRFDLTRGDQNSQFAQTFGANREDRAADVGFRNQQYGDSRADVADDKSFRNLQYGDSRKDTAFGQNLQTQQFGANREDAATSKDQFNQQFGANRQDAAFSQGLARDQFGASREDAADNRNRYDLSRQDANSQFDQTFGANRQDAATAKDQFSQTFGANREDAATQKDQFGQTLADSRSRYDLSRQDANSQFDQTFGANREDATAAREYQAGRDQVGDTRYDQAYTDQRGDVNYDRENATRLEGKGDELAAINSIQDPKAKQAAYNAYMNGEDVSKFITGTLYDSQGSLSKDYQSASPGEQAAAAKIDELRSYYPNKSEAEIQQMAEAERTQDRTLSRAPAEAATKTLAAESAVQRLANGTPQPGDFDTLPSVTTQSIPLGGATNEFLKSSKTGGWTKIGGTPYKLIKGGNTTPGSSRGDYAIMQDEYGAMKYLLPGGSITSTEPKAPAPKPVQLTSSTGRVIR